MRLYGVEHSGSPATATEIASAATATCQTLADLYVHQRTTYDVNFAIALGAEGIPLINATSASIARQDPVRQRMLEEGRQTTVKAIVECRDSRDRSKC
jgi:hypothetical protein